MTESSESFEVQLVIYDLSHGMARQMSGQFLGPEYAIDAIPHSAVVVFGLEYFFGAGIQSESPILFRQMTGMSPIQTLALGRTTVSRAQFELWCQEQMTSGRFSASAYDLLQCNCNHFAHTAAVEGLRLSQGVPDWVLQVPQRFLASPMGQMVRPMLEQMQLRAPVQGAHSMASTGGGGAANPPSTSTRPPPPQSPAPNPWANLGNGSSPKPEVSHPLLDSFVKPLLSKETKTVPLCIQKIIKTGTLDADSVAFLQQCKERLVSGSTLVLDQGGRLCQILHQRLKDEESTATTFVLMLLRVLVCDESISSSRPCEDCLNWIRDHVAVNNNSSSSDHSKLPPPAQTMAWLVLSNAVATRPLWNPEQQQEEEEGWIQAAFRAMSDEAHTLRQAAAAFCYNVVLLRTPAPQSQGDGLSETLVSLLCATLENLPQEEDATTRLRRLITAGRIFVPLGPKLSKNATAMELAINLGLKESVTAVGSTPAASQGGDAEMCRKLAVELDQLLAAHGK